MDKYEWRVEDAVNGYLNRYAGKDEDDQPSLKNINPKLNQIFETYKDEQDNNKINIEGTLKYLEDLEIDPEDMESLTLSFFLQSPSMGIFPRLIFLTNWQLQKIFSIKEMKLFLIKYQREIDGNDGEFEKLYKFTFNFIKSNENDKSVDFESAISYWQLLFKHKSKLSDSCYERLNQWYKFINDIYQKNISKDSWDMFYFFVNDIIIQDPINFKNYDEMSAWPSVIDEYVEYLRDNQLINDEGNEELQRSFY